MSSLARPINGYTSANHTPEVHQKRPKRFMHGNPGLNSRTNTDQTKRTNTIINDHTNKQNKNSMGAWLHSRAFVPSREPRILPCRAIINTPIPKICVNATTPKSAQLSSVTAADGFALLFAFERPCKTLGFSSVERSSGLGWSP